MTGFDPIKFISKITFWVMVSANIATAQQYSGGINRANVVVDYSVIKSLGPSPNVPLKHFLKPSKGDGPNNSYGGSKLKFPEATRGQPSRKLGVIVLKPPGNIKKSPPFRAKKNAKGVSKKIHASPPTTAHKTRKIRPPPPPNLLAHSKPVKVLPTPKISELLGKSSPPPPAIPALEQLVTPPPISSIKAPTQNVLPATPKFSRPAANSETRVASIPSIGQPTKPESISRIEFSAGSFALNSDASAALKDLSRTLKKNTALRLQLHAYASAKGGSGIKAKRLALSRALAARAYLIDSGVGITRIAVKALGDQSTNGPTDRIDIILTIR